MLSGVLLIVSDLSSLLESLCVALPVATLKKSIFLILSSLFVCHKLSFTVKVSCDNIEAAPHNMLI